MAWWFVLVLGCPKSAPELFDPTLPESEDAPHSVDPQVVLEQGTAASAPHARARALALLVARVGPEPWGRAALEDRSDWVRRAGIVALGSRSDPQSQALLQSVVENPDNDPYLRGLAAVRAPTEGTRVALRAALDVERESWRVAPLAFASVHLGNEGARAAFDGALRRGEFPLDLAFFVELGRSGEPGVAEALGVAQGRVEEELVLQIAATRLMLGDDTGEPALRQALASGDEERRLEAIDALVEVDHPTAANLLRRASAAGPDLVTWYADLALAARSGADSELFLRAYANNDREVRLLAVRFAGRAASSMPANRRVARAVSRVLLDGLNDEDGAIRAEACRGAADAHLLEAQGQGQRLLADGVELVRIEASGLLLALAAP